MEDKKKEKKVKLIAEKYRFSDLYKLDKPELIQKYKSLYHYCIDMGAIVDLKEAETEELKKKIKELKGLIDNKPKYLEYDPETGGIEKVIYILKENEKPMASHEIEEAILELEPFLRKKWKNTRASVVRYVSRAVKAKRLIKYYLGNRFVYGLTEWFDISGNLKEKFTY